MSAESADPGRSSGTTAAGGRWLGPGSHARGVVRPVARGPGVLRCPGEDRSCQGDPRGRDPCRDGARAGRQADRSGCRGRRRARCRPRRADRRPGVRRGGRERRRRRAREPPTSWSRCSHSPPSPCAACEKGTATFSFLPVNQEQHLVADLRDSGVTSFAMELVPRISRAQSMDALSSQALVSGYRCAIVAAGHAAPLLPPQHDRGRHGAARRGRRARRRCRRPAGDRDRQAARRRGAGLRRARRRGRGDPVDGRQGDRARPRDASRAPAATPAR